MMGVQAVLALIALAPRAFPSATDANGQWMRLVHSNEVSKARALCEPWLTAADRALVAEAHKCLANVELSGAGTIRIEGNASGGTMSPGYEGSGVDRALTHLVAGIALAPQDISIHQGRLHVLLTSGRAAEMAAALEQSAGLYKGNDALDRWLAYSPEFYDARALDAGVAFLRVLEKRYPPDHRVIGNLGAFLLESGHKDEALRYLKRAVKLAPGDAFDQWNLARALDGRGDLDGAEAAYRRAIALEKDPERKKESLCTFGHFLDEKRGRHAEGCKLETSSCPEEEQTACREKRK